MHVDALVDTGADISCMSSETYDRLTASERDKEFQITPTLAARSAGKEQMRPERGVLLDFWIGEEMIQNWPVYVFRSFGQKFLLGDDFLRAHRARIDREAATLHMRPPERDEHKKAITLHTCNNEWFAPGGRKLVRVKVCGHMRDRAGEVGIVSGTVDTVACVDALQNLEDCIWVELHNTATQPVSLRKNRKVGEFEHLEPAAQIMTVSEMLQEEAAAAKDGELTEEKKQFIQKQAKINCEEKWRPAYLALLYKCHQALAANEYDIGKSDAVTHKINLKTNEPVHFKQFRIPFAHQDFLMQQVKELQKKQVIEPSVSPYNSPVFCVKKPHSNKLRLVQDLRGVNAASYEDKHAFREVADCVDEVGKRQSDVFSSLDFLSGYWQQVMEESSRPMTAFTVPGVGRFQWTRTVMGLAGAPSSFSRLMERVFQGLDGVITYLDDVLTHSKGHKEHLKDLEKCLRRCIDFGLKLNVAKCTFGAKQVDYLGYILNQEGVRPSAEKTKAVVEFPEPHNVHAVRQFTGLTNYFSHMIPDYTTHASKLTALTKKDNTWKGGPLPTEAKAAFDHLRQALGAAPIIAHPRRNIPFTLATDASGTGFGAILTQTVNGKEHVIAYASRSLKDNEKNYSAYLLESAAAVWAIDHFHVYLADNRFVLETDHRPMETLGKVHKKTIARLQEYMSKYAFEIRYRPGKNNAPADALSRNPLMIMQVDQAGAATRQNQDDFCTQMKKAKKGENHKPTLESRWWNLALQQCFVDQNDVLWCQKRTENERRLVLSKQDSIELMLATHVTRFGGHGGVDKTMARLKQFWWPFMRRDVRTMIQTCLRCQEAKDGDVKRGKQELKPLQCPWQPNVRVHLDLFGKLRKSRAGNEYILVITDAFSKWTEVIPLKTKTAAEVANAFFSQWICKRAVPKTIVTDQGKEFVNKLSEQLYSLLEISHHTTSAYHPQTNSAAESFNREIIRYLKTMMETPDEDWECWLPTLMFSYNTRIHEATKQSPFFLTYAHEPNMPYFSLEDKKPLYGEDWATQTFQRMQFTYQMVRENMVKQQEKDKTYYDRTAKKQPQFQEGDLVMVWFPKSSFKADNIKFVRPWVRHRVVKRLSEETYEVTKDDHRQHKHQVHVNRMKPYYEPRYTWAEKKQSATNEPTETRERGYETRQQVEMHASGGAGRGARPPRPTEQRERRTHDDAEDDASRPPEEEDSETDTGGEREEESGENDALDEREEENGETDARVEREEESQRDETQTPAGQTAEQEENATERESDRSPSFVRDLAAALFVPPARSTRARSPTLFEQLPPPTRKKK